jgi:hypothetical protein
MLIPFNFEFFAEIKCAPIFKLSKVYKLHPIRCTGPLRDFDRTGSGGTSAATVLLGLGIRSDRTDRFGSSVFFKIRSSKNKDRSVSSKNEDRLIRFRLFRFGLRL